MHQVIYAVVDAESESTALEAGTATFDRLTGGSPHESAVFDYYVTFDEDAGSMAGGGRWGDLPVAAPLDSERGVELVERGVELVERGWRATVAEFERNLETVRDTIAACSTEAVVTSSPP